MPEEELLVFIPATAATAITPSSPGYDADAPSNKDPRRSALGGVLQLCRVSGRLVPLHLAQGVYGDEHEDRENHKHDDGATQRSAENPAEVVPSFVFGDQAAHRAADEARSCEQQENLPGHCSIVRSTVPRGQGPWPGGSHGIRPSPQLHRSDCSGLIGNAGSALPGCRHRGRTARIRERTVSAAAYVPFCITDGRPTVVIRAQRSAAARCSDRRIGRGRFVARWTRCPRRSVQPDGCYVWRDANGSARTHTSGSLGGARCVPGSGTPREVV